FARIAAFLDSTRSAGPTLFVDAGGAFPDVLERPDLADFMLASLVALRVDAMGVGPRDLSYGLAFLRDVVRRRSAPVVCANLVDRASRRPVFAPSRIVEVGGVRVGVLGLYGERLPPPPPPAPPPAAAPPHPATPPPAAPAAAA